MTGKIVEICCGSYYDAKQAALGGAERIELNSALMLGGLTPTESTLCMVKEEFPSLKVVAMVRPRGAGFCYTEEEFQVMMKECESLLRCGADGIAFGCLQADASLDEQRNLRLTEKIRNMGGEAVFHRAFDCSKDPFATMERLIAMGVTRVLTSGLKPKAAEGREMLKKLQADSGGQRSQCGQCGRTDGIYRASSGSQFLQGMGDGSDDGAERDFLQYCRRRT